MNDPRIRLAQRLYRIAKQTGLLTQLTRVAPTLIPRLAPLAAVAGAQAMRYIPLVIGFVALPVGLVFGTIGYNAEKAVRARRMAEDADPVWKQRSRRLADEEVTPAASESRRARR